MRTASAVFLLATCVLGATRLDEYLLPTDLVPSHYDLRLVPYLDTGNFTFDGEVTIRVTVAKETRVVTLHQNDTDIDEQSVRVTHVGSGQGVRVLGHEYDQLHHFHHINLNSSLDVGEQYDVYIKYSGHLRDDMQGLFRSSYVDSDGQTRYYYPDLCDHLATE
ncbi:hypothetical protein PR048_008954 [Dryococelus australis]|uniref:Aminopeptidase N-like N-terminal domain-containing protein n=1 Tax=Dryococelus australis TaxID=614101 RepID=A0ABQ9HYK2_9NEOP|nr:hypothetical protein PR048_008954 [Dryococelus australis]